MKKQLIALALVTLFTPLFADTPDFSKYFGEKSGCFLLFDMQSKKLIVEYNAPKCTERMSPDSTFKVPLSLMAFDQNIITQQTVFKWDGKKRSFDTWNQDQTPKSWLENSVVWVSQTLTPQLGLDTIKRYLAGFHYGNQDFSGYSGTNGLTTAWLSSTLKISAYEQLEFLKAFVEGKLPVSDMALTNTKANMYLESNSDWKLYGKTGSGYHNTTEKKLSDFAILRAPKDGWFIGFIQKENQTFVFVTNFTDPDPKINLSDMPGAKAKAITQALLSATIHS